MTKTKHGLLLIGLALTLACGDDSAALDAEVPENDTSPADDVGLADGSRLVDGGAGLDGSAEGGEGDAGAADGATGSCDDGEQNGTETDIDCGGSCRSCANARACVGDTDCESERCVDGVCTSPEGTHPDIVRVAEVAGRDPGGRSWADSYSVGDRCYCETTFDHNVGEIEVETPVGVRTVLQICEAIGPGPGSQPVGEDPRPIYNDIQCGNGPANDAGDEDDCPGRVDIGREGCGHIGPRWDLSLVE